MEACSGSPTLTTVVLSAQDNSLSSVTGLSKLTGLRQLDLARNCLTSLGQLSALHSLAHLSIEGNRLTSLAGTLCRSWYPRGRCSPQTVRWVTGAEVAAQLQPKLPGADGSCRPMVCMSVVLAWPSAYSCS